MTFIAKELNWKVVPLPIINGKGNRDTGDTVSHFRYVFEKKL